MMKKNPCGKYNGHELDYVTSVLRDDIPGEQKSWVGRFEEAFCDKLGVRYAVACNSGTSGLHTSLIAGGIKAGDEVIIPALTVIMDAYAVLHIGAIPIFADVRADTMNIDPMDVKNKITPKTKAIIAVSLQGLSTDIDAIKEIANPQKILVIEDSCQTFLGKYKSRFAGTAGDLVVWSFENKKHITCGGEGGMITTNHEDFAKKARKFAGIGYKHLTAEGGRTCLAISEVQDPYYERFDAIGLNYRMTEVSAAIGLAQFERADQLVRNRQRCAQMFGEAITGCDWLIQQKTPYDYENSYYTFAVRYYGDKAVGLSWKEFYSKYREMEGDGFYGACKVPYLEPVFKNLVVDGYSYHRGLCPVAEEIQPRIMQFKTNYRNEKEAEKQSEILRQLIKKLT